jgi:hypothetical protein
MTKTSLFHQLVRNSWEPIPIPRWMMTLKYFLFTCVGFLGFTSGLNAIELTTFDSYIFIWAGALGVGAILATFGSLHPKWAMIELIGAAIIVVFLLVLVVAVLIRESYAGALLLFLTTILPSASAGHIVSHIVRGARKGELNTNDHPYNNE